MVTDVERDYLWSTYANDPRRAAHQCRDPAPPRAVDGQWTGARFELMNSLLLSFPGTPIIYYGDGKSAWAITSISADRNGVRTPDCNGPPDRNGRFFSRARPGRGFYAPTIMDPVLRL